MRALLALVDLLLQMNRFFRKYSQIIFDRTISKSSQTFLLPPPPPPPSSFIGTNPRGAPTSNRPSFEPTNTTYDDAIDITVTINRPLLTISEQWLFGDCSHLFQRRCHLRSLRRGDHSEKSRRQRRWADVEGSFRHVSVSRWKGYSIVLRGRIVRRRGRLMRLGNFETGSYLLLHSVRLAHVLLQATLGPATTTTVISLPFIHRNHFYRTCWCNHTSCTDDLRVCSCVNCSGTCLHTRSHKRRTRTHSPFHSQTSASENALTTVLCLHYESVLD